MIDFLAGLFNDSFLVVAGLALLVLLGALALILVMRHSSVKDTPLVPPPRSTLPPSADALHADVAALLREGNKIVAIRLYREVTGLGLKESLQAVEAIERSGVIPVSQTPSRGYYPIVGDGMEGQVLEALARGNKIEAVKIYRTVTNASLKEAKDAVEAFERGESLPLPAQPPDQTPPTGLRAQVIALLRQSSKIEAIKIYRQSTGLGLKEAKDAVEQIEREIG